MQKLLKSIEIQGERHSHRSKDTQANR